MSLVRLIYASQLTEECDLNTLQQILEVSRKHNADAGISGILCYDPDFFMQWIEGPRDHINQLYNIIVQDKRHENVTIIDYEEIDERNFNEWSMAYVETRDIDQQLVLKYCPSDAFDPYEMTAKGARDFLCELAGERQEFLADTVDDKDQQE